MKLTALFLLFFCPQLFAGGYAQQINFSGDHVPLRKALATIEKQSGYSIFYKGNILKNAEVSADLKSVSVEDAVGILLKQLPYNYTIIDKVIVITPRMPRALHAGKDSAGAAPQPGASAISSGDTAAAALANRIDPGVIRGRITDANGPLTGATVTVLGTRYGAVADAGGNYLIRTASGTYTLAVTFVGYSRAEAKNIVVESNQEVVQNFTLTPNNELNEVVVSYGKQKQRNVTGAISQIDM
ncbi:MAG TPA: carboxypeptidase-like regulatory domain-containing protein, partial [Chitinophaga sp.]